MRSHDPAAGFDFTAHMRCLCGDMVQRVPDLQHICLDRVAVSFAQARSSALCGTYATLTPLRFAGGRTETIRRGRRYGIQRLQDPSGREMLYILNFLLPRFLDLDFRQKLDTTVHELWHIGPQFDGDVRRFKGRCYAHSGSKKRYDMQASKLVDRWLAADPPPPLYGFLRHDFRALTEEHGKIYGATIPSPKLIPLE